MRHKATANELLTEGEVAAGITIEDKQREQDILLAHLQLADAKSSSAKRRAAFARLRELTGQRTPAQIAHMERMQGLRT